MVRKSKRFFAAVLALTMVLHPMAGQIGFAAPNGERGRTSSDPYSLMYDSSALLAERAGEMRFLLEEELRERRPDEPGEEPGLEATREDKHDALNTEITELIVSGRMDLLPELGLSERALDEISLMEKSLKEDRYIIRYSSNTDGDAESLMSGSAYYIQDTTRRGQMEFITLEERVNPRELADQLRSSGADRIIEYIQPDFRMEYAQEEGGLSLTLTAEEEPDELEEPGDPEEPVNEDFDEEESDELEDSEGLEESYELKDPDELENPLVSPELALSQIPEPPSEIIVALIDTGVDINHEALQGVMLDGWNFADDNGTVFDSDSPLSASHGTHIAGIIAQTAGNSVKILPLQVFGSNGAYTSDIIAAIEYAEENGARIVNCSFGSTENNPALYEVISESEMLFVASAGNARSDLAEHPVYPAAFGLQNILSTASINADGGFSYFSNYSTELIDLAAPGRDILSALPGNEYGPMTGTSMSAAYVTGAVGAVLAYEDMTSVELKTRLLESADMLSNLQNKVIDGRRVNLENALFGAPGTYLELDPVDDFDVHGYAPTAAELWELYSAAGDVVQLSVGDHHTMALKENGTVWTWGYNSDGQLGNGTTTSSTIPGQVLGLTGIVFVAAGGYHSLAVKSDGTAWGWGRNNNGHLGDGSATNRTTPVQVIGLAGVTSVAAGYDNSLVVKSDGTVWAWGYNGYGQLGDGTTKTRKTPVQVSGLTGAVSVTAGECHNMALKSDGTIRAWGYNYYGQLGDGTTTNRKTPVQVIGLAGVTSVAAGYDNSLAMKSDGTVWAWGNNYSGQLGDGTTTDRAAPVQVGDLSDAVTAAVGFSHNIAVKSDGTVWAWGYGQLGNGTTTGSTSPVQVIELTGIISVSAGRYHSLAVKSDGIAWAWGDNGFGQLGDGTTADRSIPMPCQTNGSPLLSSLAFLNESHTATIPGSTIAGAAAYDQYGVVMGDAEVTYSLQSAYSGVSINSQTGRVIVESMVEPGTVMILAVCGELTTEGNLELITDDEARHMQVSAGYYHTLALKEDGTVWTWGYNGYGQLGDGTTTDSTVPSQVSGLTDVVSVAAGSHYSLAIKSDGTVWGWGNNNFGQLGDGSTTNRTTPVQVSGLTGVVSIAAGGYHSLAVKSDGTVRAWGYNSNGQLGDGTTTSRTTPVQVSGLTGVVSISAGVYYSIAAKSDGTVRAWGWNPYGQLGDGTTTNRTSPVQVNGITGVVSVVAGGSHAIAVKSNGTVWGWGYNHNGQLGDGEIWTKSTTPVQTIGLANTVSAAAGYQHSLAMKTNGTIWGWGSSGYTTGSSTPELIVGITDSVFVEAGHYHNIAVDSDGTIWAWGFNNYGQLGDGTTTNSATPVQVQMDEYPDTHTGVTDIPGISAGVVKTYTGCVNTAGDKDWFAFEATESGEYLVTLVSSSQNVLMTVYEDDLSPLSTSLTSLLTLEAEAIYYVKVEYNEQTFSAAPYTLTIKRPGGESGGDELELNVTTNGVQQITLSASNIASFAGKTITVSYGAGDLQLLDAAAQVYGAQTGTAAISGTGITVTGTGSGTLSFTFARDIPQGEEWSGVITVLRFKGLRTCTAAVSVSMA
jgi:Alpha-tubulin suppressor and related RCC1 domain-containing proteins